MNENKLNVWAAERLAEKNYCRLKSIDQASIKIEKVFEAATDCPEGDDPLCNCIYSHEEYEAIHISAKSSKIFGGYGYLDFYYILSVKDYELALEELENS